jgi:REP element-mobilizing transposase RayT
MPKPFKKNYAIRSIGYVTRSIIEEYVARQTARHRMADSVVQRQLEELQICQPSVDLSQPQTTSHAIYWYNLHLTIGNDGRWPVVRHETLLKLRDSILAVSGAKGHRLSRGGILPDHFHLPLGCPLAVTPAEIALCYLNNLAYVYDMKPVFQFGAHLRTFSEYDLSAVEGQRPFGGRVVH